MKKAGYVLLLAAVVATGLFAAKNDFGLGRNMEILINMMRELSTGYVDEVDPDRLMEDAAAGMVRRLDPYTSYLPEEEMQKFDQLSSGKYGGVGALIRQKEDYVRIAQPYAGSPADRAGLRIGDKILRIGDEDAAGFTVEQVSSRLKGDPGTTVRVEVEQLDGTRRTAEIVRERIAIPAIPYAGFVADGIGYLRHSDFTDGCYEELRAAIDRLRSEGKLDGLILDYRSNGGGIMQEAVKILGLFVPRGTEVLQTKGRREEQRYATSTDPVFADLPLVVLVNGSTASASEIVSGALQDLDRAVLIGQRTYGKGLVQSPVPVGYNAMLKLTTAKYYIPSGRCIQAVDYSRSQEGAVRDVPDSLVAEFRTAAGRRVYDGGGIMPDLFVPIDTTGYSDYYRDLVAKGILNRFSITYVDNHRKHLGSLYPTEQKFIDGFKVTDAMMSEVVAMGVADSVKFDQAGFDRSRLTMETIIKGIIGRDLFETSTYFKVVNPVLNPIYREGMLLINNDERYNRLLREGRATKMKHQSKPQDTDRQSAS